MGTGQTQTGRRGNQLFASDSGESGTRAKNARNDELLNLPPKGVIAFPGNGITGNFVDKSKSMGVPAMAVRTA
ncbi:MAG: hypothetical protein F4Y89_11165 [Gammaproteobacteria bacterium]|nr:hypothetical protein [Gammaproteobacteria bacterium]MXY91080.1 hypothetical protein [Gammaproteobacteria bacterium]MYA37767.1 hypothetical protein [Gammaproteobacteria bacterium]MYA67506.1 hypothetical protein [Gammaproteobacteria bacterium]MYG95915.1 hypothetical protein [Gammaproteobacteria bacterium]